ncbi:MAG: glucose 1-dehydrogenase [Halieaceae bacterium]|jgi:NAD(P)-dependent dehydrogenase (short-subunit alcohol dehydrogenase family)|nr:glucose 1-dehydrogenase [Halieaceae bacterium]
MQADKIAALFDLSGKIVLVTGGSRGLGLAMSRAFAAAGASVVVSSRKQDACDAAAADIAAASGQQCVGIACHVGDWDACDALVEAVYERFGRIDVLVNNAGMSPLYPSLTSVSRELWDKVLAVNLAGPFRLSAVVGERMAAGEGGSIINVSSIAAVSPTPTEVPYGTAKAGLNNLTQSIARAYAPKVRCNCIMPGPFATDISKAWTPEVVEMFKQMVPLGRVGEPEEVVGAALFLASDAGGYTTGAVIKIDGGAA